MKKIENKNKKNDKNFKYKKDMTTVLSNESDKIDKKFQKNINRSQSIKLNKTTKIKSNNDLTKYNDLIIPTTTITLTEINPNEKENINPIYIKVPIKNKFKKTPKNENKIKYKFPIINNLNKRNSSNNHNIKIFQKDNKKLSVKSVKIDLLNNNNKSEINILPRENSSEKSRKKNIINENNLTNIHEFKAEKIDIDLTEINKNNLDLNLYDAFECEQEIEKLEGENLIYCNTCRKLTEGTHKQDYYTFPPILIIILNRGRNNKDFNESFRFDETLDFTNIAKNQNSLKKYFLCGIITHLGKSGSDGHFIAYCRNNVKDNFYCYNDASVSPCSVQDAMSAKISEKETEKKTPYILLYHYMK
jgi:hypothetical protein